MDAFETLPNDFEQSLTPPSPTFRLFDLPDELWLHILAFSVTRPYPIDPTWARTTPQQAVIVAQPAITRTCQLLRKEGLPLFYSCNTFESQHLHHVACTRDWLMAIGATNRKSMKTFYFHCEFDSEFWVGQFQQCAIDVSIDEAAKENEVASRMGRRKSASSQAKTLVVTFLYGGDEGAVLESPKQAAISCPYQPQPCGLQQMPMRRAASTDWNPGQSPQRLEL